MSTVTTRKMPPAISRQAMVYYVTKSVTGFGIIARKWGERIHRRAILCFVDMNTAYRYTCVALELANYELGYVRLTLARNIDELRARRDELLQQAVWVKDGQETNQDR